MNILPRDERYSYVFEGNSQALDHVLTSGRMFPDYDIVHVNAEFHAQASDHDPQVVRLTMAG
jgi:predicted extracellular nuclease